MTRTIWIVAALSSIAVPVAAFAANETVASDWAGAVLLVVLGLPIAWAVWATFEKVVEVFLFLSLVFAFKVATLGLIRLESQGDGVAYSWHGFGRAPDGALAASTSMVMILGIAAWLIAGAVSYRWFV